MWRIDQDKLGLSERMTADAVVSLLFEQPDELPWLVADDGVAAMAPEVPEIQAVLLESHLSRIAQLWLREPGFGPIWLGWLADHLASTDASRAMTLIRALVAEAQTEDELAFIGAGLLEEVLRQQGPKVIALVEEEAVASPRFRFALAGVWPGEAEPEVWQRVTAALGDQPRY